MNVVIYTDGGSRGNPGPAGCGAVIYEEVNNELVERRTLHKFLGERTNNQAEYEAVIMAFEEAKRMGATRVTLRADSKLMIEQLAGRYKVKNAGISELFVRAHNIRVHFTQVYYQHIPREKNSVADALANRAMDEGTK